MTNEEAIKHLDTYSSTLGSGKTTQKEHEEAKRMGIQALKQQSCNSIISREAIKNILWNVIEIVDELPTVTPTRQFPTLAPMPMISREDFTNRTKYKCPSCGQTEILFHDNAPIIMNCTKCGNRMQVTD